MDERHHTPGRRAGTEPFHNGGQTLPFTVPEFWRWASSDLMGNALRGVLAEYLVAQALECANGARVEWDAFDLCTPSGLRIEVKTSGYVQSWSQRTESRSTFDIATKHGWYAASNTVAPTPERPADVYVFALHAHCVKEAADPLDVSQWSTSWCRRPYSTLTAPVRSPSA
jgi:hypothetical protein